MAQLLAFTKCPHLHELCDNQGILFLHGSINMQLTAVLIPAQEGGYIAMNPETGSTSQGESIKEALANLQEATELYLEEFPLQTYGKPLLTTFEVTTHAA